MIVHKSYKSSNFLNVIDKYAKRHRNTIADEIKRHEEMEIKKAESEITEDTNAMIQKEFLSVKNKIAIEISHKELEERKKLSLKRKSMMNEIFEACKDKLLQFTKDDFRYKEYLKSYAGRISEILDAPDVQLYIKPSDKKYISDIKESFGRECKVMADDKIIIGGIKGFSKSKKMIADETLDEKLREQEDWSAETFGIMLV